MFDYAMGDPAPWGIQAIAAGKTGQPELVNADAAVLSLKTENTRLEVDGAVDIAVTLPAGAEFQRKTIFLAAKGGAGNVVLTPSSLAGGTTLTFDTVGDVAVLQYLGGTWRPLVNTATLL